MFFEKCIVSCFRLWWLSHYSFVILGSFDLSLHPLLHNKWRRSSTKVISKKSPTNKASLHIEQCTLIGSDCGLLGQPSHIRGPSFHQTQLPHLSLGRWIITSYGAGNWKLVPIIRSDQYKRKRLSFVQKKRWEISLISGYAERYFCVNTKNHHFF